MAALRFQFSIEIQATTKRKSLIKKHEIGNKNYSVRRKFSHFFLWENNLVFEYIICMNHSYTKRFKFEKISMKYIKYKCDFN